MTLPAPFRIDVDESRPGVRVVGVHGDVDLSTCERLDAVCATVPVDVTVIVLDLTACGFVDSSGIGVLFRAQRVAIDARAQLVVVATAPRVLRTLEVTGAAASLVVVEDVATALDAVARP